MDRWERSSYFARRFAPPLDGGVIWSESYDLSVAKVSACFTTPISILKQRPGYVVMPVNGAILIRQGDPYLAAAGNLRLAFSNDNTTAICSWVGTVLTGATPAGGFSAFYSPIKYAGGGVREISGDASGDLQFLSTASNPTTSAANPGSIVTVVVYFQQIPIYPQNVGARLPLP